MPTYDVDVGGKTYEVDAPDPATAWRWANSVHSQSAPKESAPKERTTTEELGRQVGLTARAGVEGLTGLAGIVTDPLTALANKALPESMQMPPLQQSASQLLTAAGVPQPENAQERIVQQAAQALAGGGGTVAAARGIAGAAAGPVTRAVAGQMAAQPAQQLAGAAGAGAAGQIAQESGVGPAGQIAASLAGGVAGAGLAGMRGVQSAAPGVAADVEAAKRAGVNLMTSDVRQPRTFVSRTAQQAGERIPFAGTGGMREAQQTQRVDAVKSLLRDFGADDAANASEAVMADLVKKRGSDLTRYSSMKQSAMASVDDAGPVNVANTTQAIDEQIARQQAIGTQQAQKVAAVLEDFKASAQGKPLSVLDEVRKQIGKAFDGESMADIKDAGTKALQAIYGPLRQDMNDHVAAYGTKRDVNMWNVAMSRLAGLAGDLENRTLKSVLRSGEATPESVERMMFSKKPSDVRQLYASLTPEGRQNARAAILAKAAQDSGGIENISPDRFANAVKRMGASVGVMFEGDDLKRVEGLARVIDITKRSGEFAATPPTGVQLAVPLGFGFLVDALGSLGAGTAGAVTVGGLSRLYESAAVRNMLTKMPTLKRGSKEEAALAKRIVTTMQAQSRMDEAEKTSEKQTGKF